MSTNTNATQIENPAPAPAPKRRAPVAMNGVDTPTLLATVDAVRAQPELARFCFRASSRWVGGTHSRIRTEAFTGAGGEHQHKAVYELHGDHPAVLCGSD